MDMHQIWIGIFNLLFPFLGLLAYLKVKKKMAIANIPKPPVTDYFVIFATYGSLLVLILTVMINEWSGAASLSAFYLLIGAPIAMLIIAHSQYINRRISKYHLWALRLAISYFIIFPVALFVVVKLYT